MTLLLNLKANLCLLTWLNDLESDGINNVSHLTDKRVYGVDFVSVLCMPHGYTFCVFSFFLGGLFFSS